MVRSVTGKDTPGYVFLKKKYTFYTQVTQAGGREALGEELYILAAILVAV